MNEREKEVSRLLVELQESADRINAIIESWKRQQEAWSGVCEILEKMSRGLIAEGYLNE